MIRTKGGVGIVSLVGVGHCCHDYLCLIDEYPPEDGSTRITSVSTQGGGAVATAMVAASRLGIESAFIGNIGDDEVGSLILEELKREGVDVSGVEVLPGVQSIRSYVMIDTKKGTRTKFPYKGNIPPIVWDEHKKNMLKNAKILHLDGTDYENAVNAAELAKEYKVLISLDGSTRQKDNRLNKELASRVDILIMSAVYPTAVSGKPTIKEALLEISTWGPEIVMSTAGADGVFAVIDNHVYHFEGYKVNVVDTTGAGDVFHGAFLAAYLKGKNLEDCISIAQLTAALKCEHIGGRTGITDWKTVENNYKPFAGVRL
ncbi:MAG TPA: carbohydrate kinase family protein [Clostridiales bacterium]|nr:carbohydrate kinase family protein [Clostridiales bacterium]